MTDDLTTRHRAYRAAVITALRNRLNAPNALEKMPDIFLIIIDHALDMNLRELRRFIQIGLDARLTTENPS